MVQEEFDEYWALLKIADLSSLLPRLDPARAEL
jgi:hypothetical protein